MGLSSKGCFILSFVCGAVCTFVLPHQLVAHSFVSLCPEASPGLALNCLPGSLAVVVPFFLAHLPVRPVVLGGVVFACVGGGAVLSLFTSICVCLSLLVFHFSRCVTLICHMWWIHLSLTLYETICRCWKGCAVHMLVSKC